MVSLALSADSKSIPLRLLDLLDVIDRRGMSVDGGRAVKLVMIGIQNITGDNNKGSKLTEPNFMATFSYS